MSKTYKEKGRLPAFIPVLRETMRTPAWLAMSKGARWLFVALKGRHSTNFHNNGKLFISSRTAAKEISADQKQVLRWFRELEHYGFIVKTSEAHLGVHGKGKAPHWRITELGTVQKDGTHVAPTHDYLKWDGTKFKAEGEKPAPQKQNPEGEIAITLRVTIAPAGEITITPKPNCGGNHLHVVSPTEGDSTLISSLTAGEGGAGLGSGVAGVTEAERGSEVDSLSAFEAPAKRPDEIARAHYLAGWYRDERQDLPAAA